MKNIVGLILFTVLVIGCGKDKIVPPPKTVIPQATFWEKVPGNYKVYDSTGVFLYEMSIAHKRGTNINGGPVDTIYYHNFDGQFDFEFVTQPIYKIYPNTVRFGVYDPILDTNGNRWSIFGYGPDSTYNNFVNDTIIWYFQKHNTPYWMADVAPYYYCDCKQIAVKQH